MNTTESGQNAERAVAAYLAGQGFKVLELNWKTPFAEIDIVAEKAKTMYFVEVKYRATEAAGDGFDYITSKKIHHMQRAAEAYISSHRWTEGYELLVAAVITDDGKYEIDIRPLF